MYVLGAMFWQGGVNNNKQQHSKPYCNWSCAMAVVGQHPGQSLSVGLRNLAGCFFNTFACMRRGGGVVTALADCRDKRCHAACSSMVVQPLLWLPVNTLACMRRRLL